MRRLRMVLAVMLGGGRRSGEAPRTAARPSREELKEHFRRGLRTGR